LHTPPEQREWDEFMFRGKDLFYWKFEWGLQVAGDILEDF